MSRNPTRGFAPGSRSPSTFAESARDAAQRDTLADPRSVRSGRQTPSLPGSRTVRWPVYWLQRPPYLRWAAAALVLLGALAWDLRSAPTAMHPFAARAIEAGAVPGAEDVEWRRIPAGVLATPSLEGVVAAVDLAAGEPITASALTGPTTVPDGWVALPVDIGSHAPAGAEVVLIVVDPPGSVPGIVVQAQSGDPYSLDFVPAVVAVPRDRAVDVAIASTRGQVIAAIAP